MKSTSDPGLNDDDDDNDNNMISTYFTRVNPYANAVIKGCPGQLNI